MQRLGKDLSMNQELLTVRQAASRLAVHPMTVRRWVREGRLPAVQLGGHGAPVRVELEQWLASHTVPTGKERDGNR
jgi:excisionase family DNA binding protein